MSTVEDDNLSIDTKLVGGVLSLIVLFVGGGLLLTRVDFDEGERIAKEFSK